MKKTFKTWMFRIILVLIPFIIFGILELVLHLLNFGYNTDLYYQSRFLPDMYIQNVGAFNKYSSSIVEDESAGRLVSNIMAVNKSSNSLRGFVLGESAVQGFPFSQNNSFTKILEKSLQATEKYDSVEIQNLGVSAITSYCIADFAPKILAYNPDFVVLYIGNNEYYGNYSYTTGGSYFVKKNALKLKELHIGQLLDKIIRKPAAKKEDRLMEKMFANVSVPKNQETDNKVANDYIKNIESIVKTFTKNQIPVFLVEPICNLTDMPPFKGNNDDLFEKRIKSASDIIYSHDTASVLGLKGQLLKDSLAKKNANLLFLNAQMQAMSANFNLDGFNKAKDFDAVPFRPRTELLEKLREFALENSHNSYLHYIPLGKVLSDTLSIQAFSNKIFLDHVHFNGQGHLLMAKLLSNEIANNYKFTEQEKLALKEYYDNPSAIDASIYFLPLFKAQAYWNISGLQKQEPFSSMFIPYSYDSTELKQALSMLPADFRDKEKFKNDFEAFVSLTNHYYKNKNYNYCFLYYMAYVYRYPGTAGTHHNLAQFAANFPKLKDLAYKEFQLSYLLSEKNERIKKELDAFRQKNAY